MTDKPKTVLSRFASEAARVAGMIGNGYVRFFRGTGVSLVQILTLSAASFLVVFPLWYLATNFRFAYNIIILVLLALLLIFTLGKRIIRGMNFKVTGIMLIRFIALAAVLYVIRILLFENNLFYQLAGFLLFSGFFFFLCMTKGKTNIIVSGLHTLLIVLASLLLLYSVSVLIVRKQFLFPILSIIIYLVSIGYLLNRSGLKNGKTMQKV